jgi:hypothetical protein
MTGALPQIRGEKSLCMTPGEAAYPGDAAMRFLYNGQIILDRILIHVEYYACNLWRKPEDKLFSREN